MVKKLTAGVLQGTEFKESMQVEWNEQTFEVEIRALSNSESAEVESLMQEGINVKGKTGKGGKMDRVMDFDTKKNFLGRSQSDIKAVSLGTTDKSITKEVVEKEFPPKLVKEIANRIKEITGIAVGNSESDDIESFNEGHDEPRHKNRE